MLLAVPLVVFFAPSLFGGAAPGGFDLSYQSSPWRDEAVRPIDAQSPAQIDQAEQLPWVDGMWASLRDGRVPMWTGAVGGGTSLGTNPIFATYSVFTILGEIVGGAIGLVVRVVSAVAVAELFTFWFLRRMKLSVGASLFGAVAYVFSGATLMFETRNAIPFLLPVMLWCVDRLASRVTPGRIVAVALAVLALWLEGFPAMLIHVLAISGAWWLLRVATIHGLDLRIREVRNRFLGHAAAIVVGLALGGLLSAVSAIPFALQLRYNDVFGARAAGGSPLPTVASWWLLDEQGLGRADRGPWFVGINPFEGVTAVGTAVFSLALIGVVLGAWRRRSTAEGPPSGGSDAVRNFWGLTVGVLLASIYLGGPILDALYSLPGFSGNPFWRIRFVMAFGLVVLAAVGVGEVESWWSRRGAEAEATGAAALGQRRWANVAVAVAVVFCVALPFAVSANEYLDLVRAFRSNAVASWRAELLALAAGALLLGVLARATAGVSGSGRYWRSIAIGAVAAGVAFTQVGLQLTRFTPQADRAFYFPETEGYARLEAATGGDVRFLGSGMGSFAPNSAMVNDAFDARSHSFRDPQWKALMLAPFPDATKLDPLKINVDFHGNVLWNSPVIDDLSIGVLAMSSSEIPLGQAELPAPAVAWKTVGGDDTVEGTGPIGPVVGVDLRLATTGRCTSGTVVVSAVNGAGERVRSIRPVSDATYNGSVDATIQFALPLDDLDPNAVIDLELGLENTPESCRLKVGMDGVAERSLAAGRFTRPADATWQLVSAEGGLLYRRASAAPLVRLLADWEPAATADEALGLAIDPERTTNDPMPVAGASRPPTSAQEGEVEAWEADDHGISATVTSDDPNMVVASFNAAPGWTVTVDGEAEVLVAPDGALLGVEVGPGRHEVRFEYRTPGIRAGATASALGVFGCLGVLAGPRARRRFGRRKAMGDSGGTGPDGGSVAVE